MKNKQPLIQKSHRSPKKSLRKTKPVTIGKLIFLEDHGKLSDEAIERAVSLVISRRKKLENNQDI